MLPGNTLAVLLECNGKFGMIDSGEDADYPSGSDSRYPLCSGITQGIGYEEDVIAYLRAAGVTKDNFDGSETALKNELGHVDVLILGHHGYYGSNSNAYVTGLTPQMLILPGTHSAVSSNALPGDKALIDTLMEMGQKGVPLYATGWYSGEIGAIVINFDSSLSNTIPTNSEKVAVTHNTARFFHLLQGWYPHRLYRLHHCRWMHLSFPGFFVRHQQ